MSNQGDIQRYRQGNRKIRHYIWVCPGYDYQLYHMALHWVGYLPRDAELALCDLFYSEILRCDIKRGAALWFHPHPSGLRPATFPRQGGRLEHWQLPNCRVVSKVAPISLPPHGGRWHGEAVTDEGENPKGSATSRLKTSFSCAVYKDSLFSEKCKGFGETLENFHISSPLLTLGIYTEYNSFKNLLKLGGQVWPSK